MTFSSSLILLCEYSKFRIESNSYLLFNLIRNWQNYLKFSNTYLTVISRATETRCACTLPATSRCTHLSLNPTLRHVCVPTLPTSLTTAQDLFHAPLGLVQKKFEFNSNVSNWSSHLRIHEFNIPTYENGKNYSIRFKISNNSRIFDSIWFERKKHYSHSTKLLS